MSAKAAIGSGLLIPELHTGQLLIKKNLKKRNIICAHRGWRKSSFGIHLVCEHLLTGQDCAWFAPTFNVVTSANWIDFRRACYGNETWFNKAESKWTIPGKGSCYFFSMDRPATARGGTWPLAICEEMGEWSDGVYESVAEPTVQKVDGVIVAIGTPNIVNPHNDFHNQIESAVDFPDTHASYVIPAWGADIVDGVLVEGIDPTYPYCCKESPFKTFQAMQASYMRSKNKLRWEIEYLCRFQSSEGTQFENVDQTCSIKPMVIYG